MVLLKSQMISGNIQIMEFMAKEAFDWMNEKL